MPTIRRPSYSLILRRARHYMSQVCPLQPLACHALLMTNIYRVHPAPSHCLHIQFLPLCAGRQCYVHCCHLRCDAV